MTVITPALFSFSPQCTLAKTLPDQMMYEIDRSRQPEQEPSLLEMVETALNSLHSATNSTEKGYFLLIEASRIDHAGHANDPAAHVFDVISQWPLSFLVALLRYFGSLDSLSSLV
jgi:alkaline phosphatase